MKKVLEKEEKRRKRQLEAYRAAADDVQPGITDHEQKKMTQTVGRFAEGEGCCNVKQAGAAQTIGISNIASCASVENAGAESQTLDTVCSLSSKTADAAPSVPAEGRQGKQDVARAADDQADVVPGSEEREEATAGHDHIFTQV